MNSEIASIMQMVPYSYSEVESVYWVFGPVLTVAFMRQALQRKIHPSILLQRIFVHGSDIELRDVANKNPLRSRIGK